MTTRREYLREAAATLRLAAPVMVARAGILVLITVDTAMVGHASAVELASYGIALAPLVPVQLLGIGLLMGAVVLVSEARGARRSVDAGPVLRTSLMHACVLGVILSGALQFGEEILLFSGQSAELAAAGGTVVKAFSWGVPAVLAHASLSFFLEGLNRPLPGMMVMVAANVLNVFLNWLVLYGAVGTWGAEGAALTTSVLRWFTFAALLIYIFVRVDHQSTGLRRPALKGRRLLRLGIPVGLSLALESTAFTMMLVFAGWMGPIALGAFQIGFNVVGLVFMCALGFSTAASIRVAHAIGRNDPTAASLAGVTAVCLSLVVGIVMGGVLVLVPDAIAKLYSADMDVLVLAGPAVVAAGFVLAPDACQAVLTGALRGLSDVWGPVALFVASFWGVMVPAGWFLGVYSGYGVIGLMTSIALGCIAASLLLGWRFHKLLARATSDAAP
jgi:MATE family multidrug resistance protein